MSDLIRNRLSSVPMTAAGVVALALGQAAAAQSILTTPDEFSGNETLLDFHDATPPVLTTQYGGVEFVLADGNSPGVIDFSAAPIPQQFPPYENTAITNVYSSEYPFPDMAIYFASPIDRVAFEIATDFDSDLVLWIFCLSNGNVVKVEFFATDQNYRFVGLESPVPFDSVYVNATGPNGAGVFFLDNLRYEATAPYTAPTADVGGPYLVAVGETITLDGSGSSDPEGDDLTYAWWTDYGPLTGVDPSYTAGSVAGIHTASLTVDDGCLGSEVSETVIVVYDPDGGYVAGSGRIWSEPGDDLEFPLVEGRARFGFRSKYTGNGAQVPIGDTEFIFRAGDLDFQSESYQWLVVNQGSMNAQYKGNGTINGLASPAGENYKFMIWATDGVDDTFRIRIWWEDEEGQEVDVYDCGDTVLDRGKIRVNN